MLRREDSNKVLKGIKTVIFATSLSLLNPICVEAENVKSQETVIYENDNSEALNTFITITGISALIGVVGIIGVMRDLQKWRKNFGNTRDIVLGELSDEASNDNVNKAVKYLKLTNGLEAK